MYRSLGSIALAGLMSVAAGAALSQPRTAPGVYVHGSGAAAIRGGCDCALDGLKAALGITAAQEPAWDDYAAMVNGVATQMRMVLDIVHQSMETATTAQRADLAGRLVEARRRASVAMREATDDLLAALEPAQRSIATARLPGAAP
jgi:hypothetical protein